MIIGAAPDYLTSRSTPVHANELSDFEFVAFAPTADVPFQLSKGDEMITVNPNSMIKVNNGHALLNAARAGLGLIRQPEVLLKADIENGQLVRLLPDWSLQERQVSLLYHRDIHMTPRLRSFINFAIQEFRQP